MRDGRCKKKGGGGVEREKEEEGEMDRKFDIWNR